MDVQNLGAFSKTYIGTRAQKSADDLVDERCRILGIKRPPFSELFANSDLAQCYVVGLLAGGLNEYHRQLRANLLEAGICLDDFIENPLIHSED